MSKHEDEPTTEQQAVAVLPNGQVAGNVYDAYDCGYRQATVDALTCPVCNMDRMAHTALDVWTCMGSLLEES